MNPEYPPLKLEPKFKQRRKEKPRFSKLKASKAQARLPQIEQLVTQTRKISSELKKLTDAQRKAVFFKLEHSAPIAQDDLTGTDLKLIACPSPTTSLVISRVNNLDRLELRLSGFIGEVKAAEPAQDIQPDTLASRLESLQSGHPLDRLANELRNQYDKLQTVEFFKYEIEVISLEQGTSKRQTDLANILCRVLAELKTEGTVYETDYAGASARSVLWSTGPAFKRLVEGD
jgi:hypothetical protein